MFYQVRCTRLSIFLCLFIAAGSRLLAQEATVRDPEYAFKFSAYYIFHENSYGASLSAGFWRKWAHVQPSTNISFNVHFGEKNLGCRRKEGPGKWYNNTMLFNCIINPMITFNMDNVKYRYEEIDPFYFGYSSAVYNNYKSAITLGTAFVTRPRGKGNNIMTARNRSQQLTTIQIKAGVNDKTKSCIILNAYEDYLVFTETELGQIFADNRDRYYTGGGSLQFRYNQFVKFKFFSDVYTGNSYKDQFNRPDLITEDSFGNHGGIRRFFSGVRRASRYSYQDDGQPNYNRGRSMLEIDYTPAYDPRLVLPRVDLSSTTISLLVGVSGGAGNMWLQNAVHNSLSINKKVNGADKPDRFHRFYVGKDKPSIFIMGAKTDLNFFKLKQ